MTLLTALLLAAASQCTPEHAAMGHCKMAPVAKPKPAAKARPAAKPQPKPTAKAKPRPASRPASSARVPASPPPPPVAPPAPAPAAVDPKCPPEHEAMGHCKPATPTLAVEPPKAAPPATASSGPEHAADAIWNPAEMARVRRAVYAEHGAFTGSKVLLDRLEYRARDGRDGYAFEGEAWFGGDYDRLWLKGGGEGDFGKPIESVELQALYSRALDPWFNLQAGIRQDLGHGPDRTHLVVGIQGLAPYWFEIDAAAFLSTKGELTARIEAEYDQRLTNRLILQPRLELDLAAQDVREFGIGAGLSSVEAGLRLRYEIVPEFAPYIGVEWERALGRSANFARAAGEGTGGWALVGGVRVWF
jgi:copper resistance protein B